MSWNGNDLFNSTLMGGMPSGADPHQYLTTDGNGKPHWEDKLAYEASTEEVILPDTVVTDAMYKQTWVPCPNASKVKIGDTGTFYIDGKACPFEAVAGTNNYGPPADVNLYVKNHGLTTQMGYMIGFVGDQLMIYNVWLTDPGQSKTISITKNSTTIKTFDTDLMGKNAGANKALVTDENGEAVWSDSLPEGVGGGGGVIYINDMESAQINAYADAACTEWLTYEQGKAIVSGPYVISAATEGYDLATYAPFATYCSDEEKAAAFIVLNFGTDGSATGVMRAFVFSDTPTS